MWNAYTVSLNGKLLVWDYATSAGKTVCVLATAMKDTPMSNSISISLGVGPTSGWDSLKRPRDDMGASKSTAR